MVLPEDSGYALDSHRHRRHVVCGRTDKKAEMKTFEQRAICPFHYVVNKNEKVGMRRGLGKIKILERNRLRTNS